MSLSIFNTAADFAYLANLGLYKLGVSKSSSLESLFAESFCSSILILSISASSMSDFGFYITCFGVALILSELPNVNLSSNYDVSLLDPS